MNDPYKTGQFKENPYAQKSPIIAKSKVVLRGHYESRGLLLMAARSRAVQKYEIHELIASDEPEISPGTGADKIAYLGFIEIRDGGVITVGDELIWNGRKIGKIAGFDETHFPNHLNIVVSVDTREDGTELSLGLNEIVEIR
ncbi:hypothetical protein LJC01_00750 [Clostridiaceae bacterium OttesenSCG-928-D20]|nr:hypothetical protein [Clostridiaceae bacterium OttesenSCG-928-D20]